MKEDYTQDMGGGGEKKKPRPRQTMLIVAIAMAVLLIGAITWILVREHAIKQTNAELMVAYSRLDSIGNELDDKIVEIERLGGEVEDLVLVRDSLEQEKEALREAEIRGQKQIRRLSARVEGYRELLLMKDAEIEELQKLNEVLVTENTELKTERNELTQTLRQARQTEVKLTEKVAIASRLEAENIRVAAISSRGKEKEDEFRARQIDKLRVGFNIARNDVAPVEGKEILMRITDENGNVLFDVARGSGTFVLDGKETFYTAKQEILFDNTQQGVNFVYDKGSEYLPGLYRMEIFTDGYLMGSKSFRVR
jgi:cell division protein ZapB